MNLAGHTRAFKFLENNYWWCNDCKYCKDPDDPDYGVSNGDKFAICHIFNEYSNGVCDEGCNIAAFYYDGGDCDNDNESETTTTSNTASATECEDDRIGNLECDNLCNNEENGKSDLLNNKQIQYHFY